MEHFIVKKGHICNGFLSCRSFTPIYLLDWYKSVAAFIFASVDNYVRVALFSPGRFKTKEYIEKDNCYYKKNS